MKHFDTGRVQDKLLNRLERKEKQQAFQRDRFLRFKLRDIRNGLSQALLMNKIIETDNAETLSDLIQQGLKKYLRINEFDYKYFTAPVRNIVPHPNPISLYMTQYILEVILNDPSIIDVYGTDQDIYKAVNTVVTQINLKFERTEKEILEQMAKNKALAPGSKDYEIALEQLFRSRLGDPLK